MKMNPKTAIQLLKYIKTFQCFFIFGICTLILLVQVYLCLVKYSSVPTYISSYITDQNKVYNWRRKSKFLKNFLQAEFPALTFCKDGTSYKTTTLGQNGITNRKDYSGTTNHTWNSSNKSVTPQVNSLL